jgi:hypothetical protein
MAEETGFPRTRLSCRVLVATAGRGKRDTGVPLVLSTYGSPEISVVPGPVRKSLVTPQTDSSASGGDPV